MAFSFLFSSLPSIAWARDIEHLVEKGETLYSLSRRYGVAVEKLMRVNNLHRSSDLKSNMVIVIPGLDSSVERDSLGSFTTYIVKRGDTIYSIATAFGMSVSDLLAVNGLTKDGVLSLGQELVVKQKSTENIGKTLGSDFYWPVQGHKVSMGGKLEGVKITTEAKSLVHAVRKGKVVWKGPYRQYGNVVLVLAEQDYLYLYGGSDHILVNIGQEIKTGEPLGMLTDTGTKESSMIFSVFKDGEFISAEQAPRGD